MPETVQFLIVHHSAGLTPSTPDGAIEEMQLIYGFHTGPDRGWPDVCYNFFIDPFGRVFEARAGSLDGPVTGDANGGNQGFSQLVCLLGDFTAALPTPDAMKSLTATLGWLANRYDLSTGDEATTTFVSRGSNLWPAGATVECNTIVGHREMSQTECPGNRLFPVVRDELPAAVSAVRTSLGGSLHTPTVSSISPEGESPTTPPTVVSSEQSPPRSATSATSSPTAGDQSTADRATGTKPKTRSPWADLIDDTPTSTSVPTPSASLDSGVGVAQNAPGSLPLVGSGGRVASRFALGTVGTMTGVAVVGGLTWIIRRRQHNARRPTHDEDHP